VADDDGIKTKVDEGAAAPVIVTPEQAAAEEAAPQFLFGRRIEGFVRGGTHTSGHDQMMAERVADAERRRDEAAAERREALNPTEGAVAQLQTNNLALNPQAEAAYVLLKYCTPSGEVKHANGDEVYCLADIVMADGTTNLCVILVCLSCKSRGDHQGECQLRILQSNRKWYLDTRGWDGASASFPHLAGQPFLFEGKPYRSAGVIMESERFSCPNCGWSARIDKNRVIPDR
jgi:hypothetical protein